jgi:hypothetical protein
MSVSGREAAGIHLFYWFGMRVIKETSPLSVDHIILLLIPAGTTTHSHAPWFHFAYYLQTHQATILPPNQSHHEPSKINLSFPDGQFNVSATPEFNLGQHRLAQIYCFPDQHLLQSYVRNPLR